MCTLFLLVPAVQTLRPTAQPRVTCAPRGTHSPGLRLFRMHRYHPPVTPPVDRAPDHVIQWYRLLAHDLHTSMVVRPTSPILPSPVAHSHLCTSSQILPSLVVRLLAHDLHMSMVVRPTSQILPSHLCTSSQILPSLVVRRGRRHLCHSGCRLRTGMACRLVTSSRCRKVTGCRLRTGYIHLNITCGTRLLCRCLRFRSTSVSTL